MRIRANPHSLNGGPYTVQLSYLPFPGIWASVGTRKFGRYTDVPLFVLLFVCVSSRENNCQPNEIKRKEKGKLVVNRL